MSLNTVPYTLYETLTSEERENARKFKMQSLKMNQIWKMMDLPKEKNQ